eukprot:2529346-Amphidinium_carterae.1
MLWRTNSLMAECASRVFIEDPSPTIIHPKTTTSGVDDRPGLMVRLSSQCSHGFEGRAVKAVLNALKVGPSGHNFSHNLGVTCGHNEVVGIFPGDLATRCSKAFGRWIPSKSLAERV